MRNGSFYHTQEQILAGAKTVTRRMGWANRKAGDLVMAIVKGQGLPKGGTAQRLRIIRLKSTGFEPLDTITPADVILEGFPGMTTGEFVKMFCKMNRCLAIDLVNRIELEYVERHFNTYDSVTKAAILEAWAKWPKTRRDK